MKTYYDRYFLVNLYYRIKIHRIMTPFPNVSTLHLNILVFIFINYCLIQIDISLTIPSTHNTKIMSQVFGRVVQLSIDSPTYNDLNSSFLCGNESLICDPSNLYNQISANYASTDNATAVILLPHLLNLSSSVIYNHSLDHAFLIIIKGGYFLYLVFALDSLVRIKSPHYGGSNIMKIFIMYSLSQDIYIHIAYIACFLINNSIRPLIIPHVLFYIAKCIIIWLSLISIYIQMKIVYEWKQEEFLSSQQDYNVLESE
jgi:hypothetical protein